MRKSKDNSASAQTLANGQYIGRLVLFELSGEYEPYDQQARVYISHSAAVPASLGARVRVWRARGISETEVANVPLNNTEVDVAIQGPFSAIRVDMRQLGGLGATEFDSVLAMITLRKES